MTRLSTAAIARLARADGAQSHQDAILGASSTSKYRNTPTVVDGLRFDSHKEANRWQELVLLERAGEIRKLERQRRFELTADGQRVGFYVCDFCYEERIHGCWLYRVEDVKSPATAKNPLYRWKKKHLKAEWGYEIRET